MRIAQVAPHGIHAYSGGLTALVHLSIELARRGNSVEVWQLHEWPEEETRNFTIALETAGVERVAVPTAGGPWRLGRAAEKCVEARQVDLVHLHSVFSPLNNVIARKLRVPYIVSPHGGYAYAAIRRHWLRKALFRLLVELPMLRRAATVLALTSLEEAQVRQFGYRGHIEVLPNGLAAAPREVDSTVFRREIGIEESVRLAVFVGRLDVYYKRLDELVAAMKNAGPWHLALVGPQWRDSKSVLAGMIRSHGLESRVSMVPPRRGVALCQALAAADLFVLLSRSEGLPIALLEALAQGTPALVSREVERAIAVAESGAGWLADCTEVADHLRELATLPEHEWRRASARAVEFASGFEWSAIAARYEAMAREVVAE